MTARFSPLRRLAAHVLFTAAALCGAGSAHAQAADGVSNNPCGPLRGGFYGPYDYRTDRDKLHVVEEFHFTPEVEALIRGRSGYLGGDLSYTLRSFPNHHRALMAVVRFEEKMKTTRPEALEYPVECYFERAIRFREDDTVVRCLYAQYLGKRKRPQEALQQLEVAVTHAEDNPFSHYNIGLIFFELGQYDRALQQAHKAKALGFERTELADMLKRVNKWQEP